MCAARVAAQVYDPTMYLRLLWLGEGATKIGSGAPVDMVTGLTPLCDLTRTLLMAVCVAGAYGVTLSTVDCVVCNICYDG